ncbi:DNA-binding protein [Candidatus Bathyarchaeota archaeon]|nr:MAG: DNA-binding protein [Candidatus Bathyarchaeota archaeon B24-2]RLG98572.1 MAG: DNA-binding protein [Candidatus Bathyarchaeota archaeon]HDN63108.1 HEPN domain-containing protein [Candidatus Bathyarchaeota archaeon]
MKLNPRNEVSYRARLAIRYLEEAEEAYKRGDYRGTVASSQLSAENAAKAIIALFRTPSWSHDPSYELIDVLPLLPVDLRSLTQELAEITRRLAPEHGRVTYGEPLRGLTPWDLYDEESASEVLLRARRAREIMGIILSRLGNLRI